MVIKIQEQGPLDPIKEKLLLFVKKHLDAFDSYEVKYTSKLVEGMEVRQLIDPTVDDSIVSVTKCKVPGLTIEKYKAFKADIVRHTPKLDKKLVMTVLPDIEGHMVSHTHVKMPMMMTHRSVFNLYFQYEREDGSWVDLCSFHGTEPAVESEQGRKLHGSKVFAYNHCDYRLIEPYDGGCYWTSILCTDIGGSIPNYLKQQGAGEMAKNAEGILHYINTGQYPK